MKQHILAHKRAIILLSLILGLALASWASRQDPARFGPLQENLDQLLVQLGRQSADSTAGTLSASGYIEAEEVTITAEIGSRIGRILVEEGDFVQAGQLLIELDTAILMATIDQAAARVATSQARLAKIEAGVRAEEIATAEAAVKMAEAAATAAQSQWQDAITLRDNPQELNQQIEAAQTGLALAELRLQQTIPLQAATEAAYALGQQNWETTQQGLDVSFNVPGLGKRSRHINFPEGVKQDAGVAWNQAGANLWQAWVDLNASQSDIAAAHTRLADLLALKNEPQEAQLRVKQAEAAYRTAQAQVEVAQSQVAVLRAGAAPEQIALAKAQVEQAEANLAALQVQADQHRLVAPGDGWVVARPANEGEMATPGSPLLKLADLSNLTLTIYVPATEVGRLHFGQAVEVRVDTFPGQSFTGQVTFINDQPEFTPKNIQTKDERANTVYGVKISLDNPDQRLKPGMPADVSLADGSGI
jgi:multidrug resistance efflux pump